MNVGVVNSRGPGENQLRVAELLGLGAIAQAERRGERGSSGRRADRAIQPRCAQPVKESAIHAGAVQQSHRAGVTVGKDRLRAELASNGAKTLRYRIQRFVPGTPIE